MINPSSTNSSENRNPSLFLKRATSIIEKTEPITNVNTLVFLKNEKNKKFGDSFLDTSEMLDFFDSPEDNDNSFIMEDKREKEKNKKTYKIKYSKLSLEIKEPDSFISEDDIFFEEILRKKIIQEKQLKNNSLNLTHLEVLQVPFPEDPKDIKNKKKYELYINALKRELQGKFKIKDFVIKHEKKEDIISFVNKKESNKNEENFLLKRKLSTNNEKKNLFIGISINKVDQENYYIIYLYASAC